MGIFLMNKNDYEIHRNYDLVSDTFEVIKHTRKKERKLNEDEIENNMRENNQKHVQRLLKANELAEEKQEMAHIKYTQLEEKMNKFTENQKALAKEKEKEIKIKNQIHENKIETK